MAATPAMSCIRFRARCLSDARLLAICTCVFALLELLVVIVNAQVISNGGSLSWTRVFVPPLQPPGIAFHTSVLLRAPAPSAIESRTSSSTKLVLFGGVRIDDLNANDDVWTLDSDALVWTRCRVTPNNLYVQWHTMTAVPRSTIGAAARSTSTGTSSSDTAADDGDIDVGLVFGGLDSSQGFTTSKLLWIFDSNNCSLELLSDAFPGQPRAGHVAFVAFNELFILGGCATFSSASQQCTELLGDAFAFNFTSRTWRSVATANFQPSLLANVVVLARESTTSTTTNNSLQSSNETSDLFFLFGVQNSSATALANFGNSKEILHSVVSPGILQLNFTNLLSFQTSVVARPCVSYLSPTKIIVVGTSAVSQGNFLSFWLIDVMNKSVVNLLPDTFFSSSSIAQLTSWNNIPLDGSAQVTTETGIMFFTGAATQTLSAALSSSAISSKSNMVRYIFLTCLSECVCVSVCH